MRQRDSNEYMKETTISSLETRVKAIATDITLQGPATSTPHLVGVLSVRRVQDKRHLIRNGERWSRLEFSPENGRVLQ